MDWAKLIVAAVLFGGMFAWIEHKARQGANADVVAAGAFGCLFVLASIVVAALGL